MNNRAFRDATQRLRAAGVSVSDWLGVEGATIARWESGAARVPSVRARQVRWLLQVDENRKAREAAGLPTCEWRQEHEAGFATLSSPSAQETEAFSQRLSEHAATCPTCMANVAWAKEHLVNPGRFPLPGVWGHVVGILAVVPRPLWPAALGFVFLSGIVALRVVVVTVLALVANQGIGKAAALLGGGVLAAAAAGTAGAAGGLVIPVFRPWFRKLGAVGDYLTGVLVVEAYAFAIGLVAPLAFGEGLIDDGYWLFALIYGSLLGLFGAFSYRRGQAKAN